jgi:hypothetical protein
MPQPDSLHHFDHARRKAFIQTILFQPRQCGLDFIAVTDLNTVAELVERGPQFSQ